MKTLIDSIETVNQFTEKNPTLSHQRRSLGQGGRLSDPQTPIDFMGKTLFDGGMEFLKSIHEEILTADPYFGLDPLEKYTALKQAQKKDDGGFDTSPCPLSERVGLAEGVFDDESLSPAERASMGRDLEGAAEVLFNSKNRIFRRSEYSE